MQQWAFCAMRGSPGARAYHQALRQRGTGHQAALRQLGNRLVGILHGCLKTGTRYNQPLPARLTFPSTSRCVCVGDLPPDLGHPRLGS